MSSSQGHYSVGLDKNPANYVPLSPLSFLARSAAVYPNHTSAVYEGRSFTWAQTFERCKRFASFLAGRELNIHSILTYPEGPESVRAVLRVGSIETRLQARDLRAAGFEVVWPPEKPCPR